MQQSSLKTQTSSVIYVGEGGKTWKNLLNYLSDFNDRNGVKQIMKEGKEIDRMNNLANLSSQPPTPHHPKIKEHTDAYTIRWHISQGFQYHSVSELYKMENSISEECQQSYSTSVLC